MCRPGRAAGRGGARSLRPLAGPGWVPCRLSGRTIRPMAGPCRDEAGHGADPFHATTGVAKAEATTRLRTETASEGSTIRDRGRAGCVALRRARNGRRRQTVAARATRASATGGGRPVDLQGQLRPRGRGRERSCPTGPLAHPERVEGVKGNWGGRRWQ